MYNIRNFINNVSYRSRINYLEMCYLNNLERVITLHEKFESCLNKKIKPSINSSIILVKTLNIVNSKETHFC